MNYRFLIIIFVSFTIFGCSLAPVSFTQEDLKEQAESDQVTVTQNQESVDGAITLYEAIARALKYNLDFRLKLSEKILAKTNLDISKYELLPQLVTKTGYNSRDKFSGASSRSLITGTQSLQSSTSSDRDIFTSDLSLTWNVLDFGLSYIRAKQAGDKVLIAEEEKRKVVNGIVQDVRTAYWRAVSNERLIKRVDKLLIRVSKAIEESKQIEIERLDHPLTALTYQRELIGIKRELENLQQDLSLAKIQLAVLMNLPTGEDYELVIPDRMKMVNKVDMPFDMMEQLALENRPELRSVSYEERINGEETKAAILSLMPSLDLNFGKSYSTNSFLFHNNWLSYGAQISWNLLNIFKLPATNKNIEAKAKLLEARRLALSMAIMAQVHVSMAEYQYSQREYNTAADYFLTQKKILKQLESGVSANTVTEQSLIREQMNMVVAEIKYDIAYADVENAYAGIFATLGIDPFPINADMSSVKTLTHSIKKYFDDLSLKQNNGFQ